MINILNFLGPYVCGLFLLLALCIVVMYIFNRSKLVRKLFGDGDSIRLFFYNAGVSLAMILYDIAPSAELKPGQISNYGMMVAYLIIFYGGFALVMGLVNSTENFRSKFKNY